MAQNASTFSQRLEVLDRIRDLVAAERSALQSSSPYQPRVVGCLTGSTFTPEAQVPPNGAVYPTLFAVAARPTGRVIAVGADGSFSVAYASSDFGATWVRIGFTAGFDQRAVVNVPNTATWYSAGDRGVAVSTNDGVNWTDIRPPTWTDAWGMATPQVAGFPGTVVLAGSYGQV